MHIIFVLELSTWKTNNETFSELIITKQQFGMNTLLIINI